MHGGNSWGLYSLESLIRNVNTYCYLSKLADVNLKIVMPDEFRILQECDSYCAGILIEKVDG